MVDPDAPSRQKPSRAYWRHWLLVEIKVWYNESSSLLMQVYAFNLNITKNKALK